MLQLVIHMSGIVIFFIKFPLVSFFLNLHEPCPWINKSRALEGYLHLLLVTKIN